MCQGWLENVAVFDGAKRFSILNLVHFGLSLSTIHLLLGRECLLRAVVHVSPMNLITLLVRHCLSPSFPKAGPACPDVCRKVTKTFLTASRIVREEEGKSWLPLTGVSPQIKAANIICQKLYTQMLIDKAPGYHVKYHKKLPSQWGWKRAWDKKELQQAGAFLGKPIYIYCISLPGLSVSLLHLCSPYTHKGTTYLKFRVQGCWRGDFDDWWNKIELIKLMLFSLTVPSIISEQQTTGRLQVHEGEIRRKELIFPPI